MTREATTSAEAERNAEKAREDLNATIEQLKDNLRPSRLAGEAVAATRARTPDWLVRYWSFAASPAGLGLIGATAASLGLRIVKRRGRRLRPTR